MFTGIIEVAASVTEFCESDSGARLTVESSIDHTDTALGDSIAIDGVCLTVVDKRGSRLSFDLVSETLRVSTLGRLVVGQKVNLERSLKVGQPISGHFVFGHVDRCLSLISAKKECDSLCLSWDLPKECAPFITTKGSIALNGVSLTVGSVGTESFDVYVVPHTAQVTNLSHLKPGDLANLEIDMLARYAWNILKNNRNGEGRGDISIQFLKDCGFIA